VEKEEEEKKTRFELRRRWLFFGPFSCL
jgi:hypothetical protein